MSTVTLSIGRNVGDSDELSIPSWSEFRTDLEIVAAAHLDVVFIGTGRGIWEGRVTEDAHTIVGLSEETTDLEELGRDLGDLARRYSQEAIAMTVGNTTLVAPRPSYGIHSCDPDIEGSTMECTVCAYEHGYADAVGEDGALH